MFPMLDSLKSRLHRTPAAPGLESRAPRVTDPVTLDALEAAFFAQKAC